MRDMVRDMVRDMWPSLIPNDTPLSPTLTFPRSSFLVPFHSSPSSSVSSSCPTKGGGDSDAVRANAPTRTGANLQGDHHRVRVLPRTRGGQCGARASRTGGHSTSPRRAAMRRTGGSVPPRRRPGASRRRRRVRIRRDARPCRPRPRLHRHAPPPDKIQAKRQHRTCRSGGRPCGIWSNLTIMHILHMS